jgi:acyl-CoA synthetase (AMP-forming)/AMP-acid ligase II
MPGYLNNPAATAGTFDAEGFLRTGDIGYRDARGNFYIVDRAKELIKCKGFQVAPAELEGLLLRHPGVADAAVVPRKDARSGEVPLAFVVRRPPPPPGPAATAAAAAPPVTEAELQAFVAGHVAEYKALAGGVRFVDAIPKSASGKILRRVLRDGLTVAEGGKQA